MIQAILDAPPSGPVYYVAEALSRAAHNTGGHRPHTGTAFLWIGDADRQYSIEKER